ncbi:hypothetical protein B0H13DRAFT_2029227 [Mycena leptocephala]|nr:hypothetical protein B0H13DRAFT_2029227 [Mycena leptocephala]
MHFTSKHGEHETARARVCSCPCIPHDVFPRAMSVPLRSRCYRRRVPPRCPLSLALRSCPRPRPRLNPTSAPCTCAGMLKDITPPSPRATLPASLPLYVKSRSRRDESAVRVTLVSRVIIQLFLVRAPLVSSSASTPYPGLNSSHLHRECAQR